MEKKRKVLIVDDTATYRQILTQVAENLPNIEVIGRAQNGKIALKKLEITPVDIVLLDVYMPEMGGLETLREIQKKYPSIQVIMFSSEATDEAGVVMEALRLGALDFIPKPKLKTLTENLEFLTREVTRVLNLVDTKQKIAAKKSVTRPPFPLYETDQGDTDTPVKPPPPPTKKIDLVAIGVSTGGPSALGQIIPALPGNLDCPVVIVQHMPPNFTRTLSEHLNKQSQLTVKEGAHGEILKKNTVYIAPGGHHMIIGKNGTTEYKIALNEDPPVNSCRPAVDTLFESIAKYFNGNVLAVILTGMGEDGAEGIRLLKTKECRSIAQDRQSCVVYGMPRAIINRGLADETIPLKDIADRIKGLCLK